MTEQKRKGHVEFRQPPVKLAADLPGDEQMREELGDMQMNDGYPGSCGVAGSEQRDQEEK